MRFAALLALLLAAACTGDDPLGLEQRAEDRRKEAIEARQRVEQEMVRQQEEAERAAITRERARVEAEKKRLEAEESERLRVEWELEQALERAARAKQKPR